MEQVIEEGGSDSCHHSQDLGLSSEERSSPSGVAATKGSGISASRACHHHPAAAAPTGGDHEVVGEVGEEFRVHRHNMLQLQMLVSSPSSGVPWRSETQQTDLLQDTPQSLELTTQHLEPLRRLQVPETRLHARVLEWLEQTSCPRGHQLLHQGNHSHFILL